MPWTGLESEVAGTGNGRGDLAAPVAGVALSLLGHATEGIPYALKSHRQLPHDELGLEMQQAKSQRLEPRIPPSISAEPSSVIRPIDLDHEPAVGSEKVDDVLAQHDLPPERDPELSTGQLSPQASF
jgi:hypothetical protein